MNVAITGISGYIWRLLTDKLDRDERVGRIVGIDLGDFVHPSPKLKHYKVDIRDPKLRDLFDEEEVDAVVHLAFIIFAPPDPAKQRDVNVNGSRNVLRAAGQSGVRKFIFASSTTVYGAH